MVKLIEQNFSNFYLEMAQIKGCAYNLGAKYNWVKSIDEKWPSGIFDIRLKKNGSDEDIQELVMKMKSGLLPRTIMTGPSTMPNDFDAYFGQYGLTKMYEASGMALHLTDLRPEQLIPDLQISVVNEEMLQSWCKIVYSELFRRSDGAIEDFYQLIQLAIEKEKIQCFAAKYQGKIVATSCLYAHEGVAGIYFVATLQEYRGRGIGRQITIAPLLFAKEQGYKIATLQASPLGVGVYGRIGFKEYCRLGRYQFR